MEQGFAIVPPTVLELPPVAVKVYGVLATFASYDENRECWPSVATLAERAKMCVRTVQSALRVLREAGVIEVQKQLRNGKQWSNLYRLGAGVQPAAVEREDMLSPDGEVDLESASRARGRAREDAVVNESLPGMEPDEWGAPKVGLKPVTPEEGELAAAVVGAFNDLTGRSVSVETHSNLTLVVGRIRENPKLRVEHYAKIIRRQMAAPWWASGGPPELRMIFSPKAFEVALGQAREWDGGPVERPSRNTRGKQTFGDLAEMAARLDAEDGK